MTVRALRDIAAAIFGLALATTCGAQIANVPQFRLEPGLLSADFLSPPAGLHSTTGFNIRFETRFPTQHRWLTPVLGASIAPYGTSGAIERNLNTPSVFFGNVFPVLSSRRTDGWATIDAPLLFYYSYRGGGPHNRRLYGRDIFVQLAGRIHLGRKSLSDLGAFWSRVDVYAYLEQNLTPNRISSSQPIDHFNPTALVGLSIPIGPTAVER